MKVTYLLLVILFSCFKAEAQPIQRNLLQKFSYAEVDNALLNKEDWKPFPKTPDAWKKVLSVNEIAGFISQGDSALKKDFKSLPATAMLEYVRINDRANYERQSFTKRTQLWDLVLAESMEGKGRFTDKITDGIWSICEESFWGVPAHLTNQKAGKGLADVEDPTVDLFAAETASVLAWADYFVGEELDKTSKLLRPRIVYEVNRRILNPIMVAKYNWLMRPDPNNWVPWIMSNCITASLLLEKDRKKRSDLLYFAMQKTDRYINNLGDDGAVDEGPSYWSHAAGCVFDVLDLLNSATKGKVNIYQEPLIDKMAAYIYKTHIAGDYFINVADAAPKLKPDGIAIYRFGKSVDDQKIMSFGSWIYHHNANDKENSFKGSSRSRKLFNIMAKSEVEAYPAKLPDVGNVWFPSIQLMATRSKGLFVASHGGHNGESHNHNDVGDFIIYADNYPVIIDAGVGTYTAKTFSGERYNLWFNSSAFHNLPIINGVQQLSGREAKATGVTYQSNKNATSLTMDIALAYPDSVVKSWRRTVQLNKNGILQISDEYLLPKVKNNIKQTFMTICTTKTNKPGMIIFELPNQKSVVLKYDAAKWSLNKEKVSLDEQEDAAFKKSWGGKDIWRLTLENKDSNSAGISVYKISLEK